jgi:hypothetical protein
MHVQMVDRVVRRDVETHAGIQSARRNAICAEYIHSGSERFIHFVKDALANVVHSLNCEDCQFNEEDFGPHTPRLASSALSTFTLSTGTLSLHDMTGLYHVPMCFFGITWM